MSILKGKERCLPLEAVTSPDPVCSMGPAMEALAEERRNGVTDADVLRGQQALGTITLDQYSRARTLRGWLQGKGKKERNSNWQPDTLDPLSKGVFQKCWKIKKIK